jgi:hypothetical protein
MGTLSGQVRVAVAVTAELQPAAQLLVEREQCTLSARVDHERRRGQVSGTARAPVSVLGMRVDRGGVVATEEQYSRTAVLTMDSEDGNSGEHVLIDGTKIVAVGPDLQ